MSVSIEDKFEREESIYIDNKYNFLALYNYNTR